MITVARQAARRAARLLMTVLAIVGGLNAAPPALAEPPAAHHAALVIGSADYLGLAHLPTPLADARTLATALAGKGYDVVLRENATAAQLAEALNRFSDRLSAGDIGLVYFSGLVGRAAGVGLLLGIDADLAGVLKPKDGLDLDAVAAQLAVRRLQGGVILIDPRRPPKDSPAGPPERYTLDVTPPPPGVVVAMVTLPDMAPATAGGRPGLLVDALLGRLARPAASNLDELLHELNISVTANGGGAQIVWEASGGIGKVLTARAVFGPVDATGHTAPPVHPVPGAAAPPAAPAPPNESDDDAGLGWLGWASRLFGGWAVIETLESVGETLFGWLL
ncbi:MAG: hypothetical protein GC191_10880 [Azospirillum sp.]|nr:hypothetical protein [Azospirillum sp.]